MIVNKDYLTTDQRAKLSVAGGFRKKYLDEIYRPLLADTTRQLDIWPLVLTDWMSQSMMYSGDQSTIPEWDIVFAERISGIQMQGNVLPHERKRWVVSPDEFPKMFDHMRQYEIGR